MPKLVSVIIPTYNRAHSVIDSIKSVKDQSYPNIQIIVADDGSQDNTSEAVAQFADVEYYYQENRGQGSARNLGLLHAEGEYIASLDSDDYWNEDFLEVSIKKLEDDQLDFVFLNWTQISDTETMVSSWERSKTWRKYLVESGDMWNLLDAIQVRELFLMACPAPSSALVIRRSSFASPWNEEMRIADDWCLVLDMVLAKPCRAAFTLARYWTKRVSSDNVYHGRHQLGIIEDLGLHDEPLMAKRFHDQLSFTERAVLRKRLASHHFNFGRLNMMEDGVKLQHLQSIATSIRVSPSGSVVYFLQMTYNAIKNHLIGPPKS
jgi:glycosyltransferase involved in cell wall biosynthesis